MESTLVAALVRRLHREGRDFESLTVDEWRAASDKFDRDVVSRITPRVSAGAKQTPQSTAPEAVAARLSDVQRWLAGLK